METSVRKYVIRMFLQGQKDNPCFYSATYFVPPVVPRIGETIGLDSTGTNYIQYKVVSVNYDFPNVEENYLLFVDLTVEELHIQEATNVQ